jgi:hypothetical protein
MVAIAKTLIQPCVHPCFFGPNLGQLGLIPGNFPQNTTTAKFIQVIDFIVIFSCGVLSVIAI